MLGPLSAFDVVQIYPFVPPTQITWEPLEVSVPPAAIDRIWFCALAVQDDPLAVSKLLLKASHPVPPLLGPRQTRHVPTSMLVGACGSNM